MMIDKDSFKIDSDKYVTATRLEKMQLINSGLVLSYETPLINFLYHYDTTTNLYVNTKYTKSGNYISHDPVSDFTNLFSQSEVKVHSYHNIFENKRVYDNINILNGILEKGLVDKIFVDTDDLPFDAEIYITKDGDKFIINSESEQAETPLDQLQDAWYSRRLYIIMGEPNDVSNDS